MTFQPGCTIKYKNNAYMLLYGPISFPPVGQMMPVFTSRNDDLFGARIAGVAGETDSNGDPTLHKASQAILIYYNTYTSEIRNARIRWANIGIQNEGNLPAGTLGIHDCLFQNITGTASAGIAGNLSPVTVANLRKCNVTNPGATMTEDCGPFYVAANYTGLTQQEAISGVPADPIGAVGPAHFMVMGNGQYSVAVYDKYSGVRKSPTSTTLSAFFGLTVPSGPYAGTYPVANTCDSRLLYDPVNGLWVASALDLGNHHVILAVCRDPDPVGIGDSSWINRWTKYLVPFGYGADYDHLGIDINGIYLAAAMTTPLRNRVYALPAEPFRLGTAGVVQSNYVFDVTLFQIYNIIPAVNLDITTTNDPAWFVVRSNPIYYSSLTWQNGVPTWQPNLTNSWSSINDFTNPFYDIGDGGGLWAPQLGSSSTVELTTSRHMSAVARKIGGSQYLWTCRMIGVNSAGTHTTGQPADRAAVEWLRIQTSAASLTSGRIYDPLANPKHYYMPTLTVNATGDALIGCAGSSVNDYIGAYYSGKLNGEGSFHAPTRYFAGKAAFNGPTGFRWGDYSYTSLDPDGRTMWTIQQYAETPYGWLTAFGTRIVAITPF